MNEFLQTLAFWAFLLGFLTAMGWFAWKIDRWGKAAARAKRDRQIEAAMRIAMADADAQQRIARKILNEGR